MRVLLAFNTAPVQLAQNFYNLPITYLAFSPDRKRVGIVTRDAPPQHPIRSTKQHGVLRPLPSSRAPPSPLPPARFGIFHVCGHWGCTSRLPSWRPTDGAASTSTTPLPVCRRQTTETNHLREPVWHEFVRFALFFSGQIKAPPASGTAQQGTIWAKIAHHSKGEAARRQFCSMFSRDHELLCSRLDFYAGICLGFCLN